MAPLPSGGASCSALTVGLLSVCWESSRGQELAASDGREPEARPQVKAVLETPGFRDGHWGLLVVDAKTGPRSTSSMPTSSSPRRR